MEAKDFDSENELDPKKHVTEASKHFTEISENYDAFLRATVPNYEELTQEEKRLIHSFLPPNIKPNVLDLGIGSGNTSKLVLERCPSAHIIGYDVSDRMLKKAKMNLEGCNVDFVLDNMSNIDFDDKFDMAISAIAVHHLTDQEKQELYKKVFKALRIGGTFILADVMTTGDSAKDKQIQTQWSDYMEQQAGTEFRDFILGGLDRLHMPASIGDNLKFLKEAGFTDVQFCWQGMTTAVLYARK